MTTWAPLPSVVGITPGDHATRRDIVNIVEGALRAGLEMVILREPQLDGRQLVDLARRIAPALGDGMVLHAKNPAAIEIAEAARWGLHLPSGADVGAARARIRGWLGVSCHNALEIAAARQAGADYVTLSPVYAPASKPEDHRRPLGSRTFGELARSADIPVVALGGINPRRAAACRKAGAHAVAAIGWLWGEDHTPEDAGDAARALIAAMSG